MKKHWRLQIMLLLSLPAYCFAQQAPDSLLQSVKAIPASYYSAVNKKLNDINDELTSKTLKYLSKFQRQEERIQQKLKKLNPELVVTDPAVAYNEISQEIKNKTATVTKVVSGEYVPNIDSLGNALSFLKQVNGLSDKVSSPLKNFDLLQGNLQETEKVQAFIAGRKEQVKELLSKLTRLPGGLKNEYAKLNKTAYYYRAQIQAYESELNDPQKIQQDELNILNRLPAFQKFMKENGQLASPFKLPDNNTTAQILGGLQTRSSVQSLIQQRIASGGPNAKAQIEANLAAAHAELNKLKDKMNDVVNKGGGINMDAFTPNDQKTKSFGKRLEYSADLQTQKSGSYIPPTATIGLGIGYKLNDKSSAGIGVSYKAGMGAIRHISFTSQALGLRSYMDWKIKKQFYVNGGYEMNYNSAFKNIEQLKNYDAWQRSALLGISKKYKISKKVKGEMKLLYDFLAYQHIPVSQPFVFRIGYKF